MSSSSGSNTKFFNSNRGRIVHYSSSTQFDYTHSLVIIYFNYICLDRSLFRWFIWNNYCSIFLWYNVFKIKRWLEFMKQIIFSQIISTQTRTVLGYFLGFLVYGLKHFNIASFCYKNVSGPCIVDAYEFGGTPVQEANFVFRAVKSWFGFFHTLYRCSGYIYLVWDR